MQIFVAMIESEFSFFDVKVEKTSRQPSVLGQAHFRRAPEGFYTVHVIRTTRELVLSVMHPKMPFVAGIDEAIISFPTIGMDDTFVANFSFDDCFKSLTGAVFKDIGMDSTCSLIFQKKPTLPRPANRIFLQNFGS